MRKILFAILILFITNIGYCSEPVLETEWVGKQELINQNFEGIGYDNNETWIETGTPNPDYTATVLRGSQSFYATDEANYATISFSAKDEIWGHILWQFDNYANYNHSYFLSLYDTNDTQMAYIRVNENVDEVNFYCYGGWGVSFSTSPATNTKYHLWFHYKNGTGNNAIFECWYGTSTIRPASSGGSYNISDEGDGITKISKIKIGNLVSNSSVNELIDQVIIKDEEFTEVEE